MRNLTPTGPTFTANAIADVTASHAMALSASQLTRAAIARWSGSPRAAAARDVPRISPQARFLAKVQQDLDAFMECGGFSQIGHPSAPALLPPMPPLATLAPLATPVMFKLASTRDLTAHGEDACID